MSVDSLWTLPERHPNEDNVCVLFTTGGLNPIHKGHVHMMTRAKEGLEARGWTVWCGFMSPSHDLYLDYKQKWGHLGSLDVASATHRIAMAELTLQDQPWLQVGRWESGQHGYWPDYPEVIESLLLCVQQVDPKMVVFYVCGSDHARNCEYGFGHDRMGLVVVPRIGDVIPGVSIGELVRYLEPDQSSEAFYSSTRVRTLLKQNDTVNEHDLVTMIGRDVLDYIRQHRLFVDLEKSDESRTH